MKFTISLIMTLCLSYISPSLASANSEQEILIKESQITIKNRVFSGEKLDLKMILVRDEYSPKYITLKFNKNFYNGTKCTRYSGMHVGNGHIVNNCVSERIITISKQTSINLNLSALKALNAGEVQKIELTITQSMIGQNIFKRDYMNYTAKDILNNYEISTYTKRFRPNTIYLNEPK